MTKRLAVAAALLLLVMTQTFLSQDGATPQLGKNSVAEVISAMTTEEKAALLVGMGMELHIPGVNLVSEEDKKIRETVAGAAGRTHAIPRLGIPSITLSDGPAGVRIDPIRNGDTSRTYYATGFPIATLVAASWDTNVAHRIGLATGSEAREYGIDIMLAPAMNIHRNPLGGRNFEYYSEDPLLSGMMAAAYVKGVQANGVGTSIKHFAANNQEFNRMQSNSIVGERALREIYLKGFEIAVKEGQPWTVMSSYNLINGTFASQNPELLTTLLRDEWGFKGFVMTDWFGGNDPVAQLKAGNDVLMPGVPNQPKAIIAAVENGSLSKQVLDQNVARVLNIIVQSQSFKNYKCSNQPDLKADAQIARETAAEGMVLLKNEGQVLPLSSSTKIALWGNSSYDLTAGGTGSGDVNKKYVVSLAEALAGAGVILEDSVKTTYTEYVAEQKARRQKPRPFELPPPLVEMPVTLEQAQRGANDANLALITLGRNSGEFKDRTVADDFTLTANERALIENVSTAFHAKEKKVVVLLNVGGPVEIVSWRSLVDAILLAWQPGQEGGNAIADVLTGKVNPSGKLPMTFPATYSDVPSAKTFPGRELVGKPNMINLPFAGKPAEALYEEGIYVGYRYYNTFSIKPAYEFGYGLSYTNFTYKDLRLSSQRFRDKVIATVSVLNSGKTAGKEVVELYVGAPRQKLSKPMSELRAFAKTKLLQPGELQTLTFTLMAKDLASYDEATSAWVAEAGSYKIMVGASSLKIKNTATLEMAKDLVVEKSKKLMAPTEAIKELELANR